MRKVIINFAFLFFILHLNSQSQNYALKFNGIDQYVQVDSKVNLSPTSEFTVEAWIKVDSASLDNRTALVFDRLGPNDGFGLTVTSDGLARLSINGGGGIVTSSINIANNKWNHIAGSYDRVSGELKVFINGVNDGISSYFSTVTYSPEPRKSIGGPGGTNDRPFPGDIDEVRIWNYARTDAEIQADKCSVLNTDSATGLIGYWPLNEGTGITIQDYSNSNNGGTFVNNPIWHTDTVCSSAYNYALNFNGTNQYVQINSAINMSPQNSVSIEAWIRGDSAIVASVSTMIYDRLEINDGFGLAATVSGHLRLSINGGVAVATSSDLVINNKWNHVAGSYDKNDGLLKVYVNGVLSSTSTYNSQIAYSPEPRNSIGGPGGPTDWYFAGDIDNVRIWNYARSAAEINNNMCSILDPMSQPGLVAYWRMLEGTGTIVRDLTANKNHGLIINNAPWVEDTTCASPILLLSTAKSNVSCNNLNDGSVIVFPSGGTPPFYYSWSTVPNKNTTSISNLTGGIYSCEVSDSKGYSGNVDVTIFEPAALSVFIITNAPNPGDLNLLVSGGINPYRYNWSNGATTEDLSNVSPGFYFCQVSDHNGCAKVVSVILTP